MTAYRTLILALAILSLLSLAWASNNEAIYPLAPSEPLPLGNLSSQFLISRQNQTSNDTQQAQDVHPFFPPSKNICSLNASFTSLLPRTSSLDQSFSNGSNTCALNENSTHDASLDPAKESSGGIFSVLVAMMEWLVTVLRTTLHAVVYMFMTLYSCFFGTTAETKPASVNTPAPMNTTLSANATSNTSIVYNAIVYNPLTKFITSIPIFWYGFLGLLNPFYGPVLVFKLGCIATVWAIFFGVRMMKSGKKDGTSLNSPIWFTFMLCYSIVILRCGL